MADEDTLRDTFLNNRDPYATIARVVFHKDYWECMEHHEDGTPNPDGKALRSKAKGLMLGILYGMGAKLMSQIIGTSIDECKQILNDFFNMFPKVKDFVAYNEKAAKEKGYVEDYLGRIRHLPDAMLDEIEVTAKKEIITDANLFIDYSGDCAIEIKDEELTRIWEQKYREFCRGNRFDAKNKFKELAKKNGISIKDNGAFISKSMTQCTNSRIQGSAATLTKKAMVKIHNDPIMKELGFRILVPVHDELMGECPIENAEKAEKRLSELMIESAKPECSIAMKCDTYVVKHWYADETFNQIHDTFEQMTKGNDSKGIKPVSREEALNALCSSNTELLESTVISMCDGTFDVLEETV